MAMTVGAAAEAAGVSAKAVRLWESRGLLRPAERTESGYRLFTDGDVGVLRFIRRAKALGLHLSEVKEILDLQREGAAPCTRVTELLDGRIAEIDRTRADLLELRRTLTAVRQAARDSRRRGEEAVVCRIIETAPAPVERSPECPVPGQHGRAGPRASGGSVEHDRHPAAAPGLGWTPCATNRPGCPCTTSDSRMPAPGRPCTSATWPTCTC